MWRDLIIALGILALIILVIEFVRKKTETKIISDDAIKVLNNREKAEKLRNVVSEYHKTGEWNQEKLGSLI